MASRKNKVAPSFFNGQHKTRHRLFKSTLALILPWWLQNIILKKMILSYSPTVKNVAKSRYRGNLAGRKFGRPTKYTLGLVLPVWVAFIVAFIIKIIFWIVYRIIKIILFFVPLEIDWLDSLFEFADIEDVAEFTDLDVEDAAEMMDDIQDVVKDKVEDVSFEGSGSSSGQSSKSTADEISDLNEMTDNLDDEEKNELKKMLKDELKDELKNKFNPFS